MKNSPNLKPTASSLVQEPQHPAEMPTEPNKHIPESEPNKPDELPVDPNRNIPEQIPLETPTEPNPRIPEFPGKQ